jgi:hypothetical protein
MVRKAFTQLDNMLIDAVCQPAVDRISAIAAFRCDRISRCCLDLSSVAWIVSQAGAAVAAAKSEVAGLLACQIMLMMLGLTAMSTLRSAIGRIGRVQGGHANPLRPSMTIHRLSCLIWLVCLTAKTVMAPAEVASLALFAVGALVTAGIYVGACANRPPARRQSGAGRWQQAAARGV